MSDINSTLNERGGRYGRFRDNAYVTEQLMTHLMYRRSWTKMEPVQREAMRMICHKIARIVCGDPFYDDSWRDIAGYAQLVVEYLDGTER